MIAPLDTPGADGHANREPAAAGEVGPSSPQNVRPPDREIVEFHRRLIELTPRVLVTPAIVALNAVVFVLMVFSSGELLSPDSDTMIAWGSNLGSSTLDGQWWRLLTCTFIHFGIIHVGFNMWILRDAGHLVERLVGNVGFLVLYVLSGLFGSLASVYYNPHVNSAGASGAVFGVFGALMGFIILRGDSVPKTVLSRLRSSGLTFVAINLAIGFSIRWIDNAAHIGGLVAGFVCGVLMSHPLDRATKTSRAMRNLLTAAVGAGALLAAVQFAPEPPIDVDVAQQEVLDTYNEALSRLNSGKITSDEFADIVNSKVLPSWRNVWQVVDGMRDIPPKRKQLLKQFAKACEEEWKACAVRVREPNAANVSEHEEKQDAVVKLIERLNSR